MGTEAKIYLVWLALLAVVGLSTVATLLSQRQAERPESSLGPWKVETCRTNPCIATLLNRLPSARAAEAKLTTWHDLTYVWYRE